jgi:hypothetical protein
MDLQNVSDADIQKELERRRQVATEQERNSRDLHRVWVLENKDKLLELVPAHNRTSCSDKNLANAWDGRCVRCVLMEAKAYNNFNADLKVVVDIHIKVLPELK